MKYNQFIRNSLENMGSSFLFGVGTKLLLKNPDLYGLRECVQSGIQMCNYTMVHSINVFLLSKLGVDGLLLSLSSVFLTSFYLGMRNGVEFARKDGMNSVVSNIIKGLLGRVKVF